MYRSQQHDLEDGGECDWRDWLIAAGIALAGAGLIGVILWHVFGALS